MIIFFSTIDINPVAQEADPAPPLVPIVPLPRCPVLLQGGEGTPTLLLALALGVAQGHALHHLRDYLSGTRAGDCIGNRIKYKPCLCI